MGRKLRLLIKDDILTWFFHKTNNIAILNQHAKLQVTKFILFLKDIKVDRMRTARKLIKNIIMCRVLIHRHATDRFLKGTGGGSCFHFSSKF